jgi:hypothetical protein
MADKKPLWEVMRDAAEEVPEWVPNLDGCRYAAELRAIADEVVPEEPEPWLGETAYSTDSPSLTAAYRERQRFRQRLLDAAAKAEDTKQGGGGDG